MTSTEEGTFFRFDPADHLTTFEDVAAYLEAIIEEGEDDPAVITQALGAIARSRNLSEIARQAGMSREGLHKALSATGNPSFATVMKVARALGLRVHFEAIA
jgi:probable addiction module antidote protein